MFNKMKICLYVLVVVAALFSPAHAVSRDEIIKVCREAGELLSAEGLDSAIKAIGNPKGRFVWNNNVSYVFLMNMKGKMLAHPFRPELTKAESLLDQKDTEGRLFFVDFVKAAEQGAGWTNYLWPLPNDTKPIRKYTYIYRIPNTDFFVGSGMYVLRPGEYY